MGIVVLLCFLLALVFFALSAFAVPSPPRFGFLSVGLFFLTLALALQSGALNGKPT